MFFSHSILARTVFFNQFHLSFSKPNGGHSISWQCRPVQNSGPFSHPPFVEQMAASIQSGFSATWVCHVLLISDHHAVTCDGWSQCNLQMNSGAARLFNVLSVSLGTAPAHVGETMQRMNPSSAVDDQVIVGEK